MSDIYANIPRSDGRPRISAVLRDAAIRAACLRRPYWGVMTALSANRPYLQLLRRVIYLEGDVAECGVFRGRTLLRMAMFVDAVTDRKTVHGFDSFHGFPPTAVGAGDLGPGRTFEKVRKRFQHPGPARDRIERAAWHLNLNVQLHAGYFEETLPRLLEQSRRFCFVHLDCDLYESYRTCLNHLYDALVPGGIMLFDEYACPVWPGATEAVDEFLQHCPERPLACDDPGRRGKPKYYIVKDESGCRCSASAPGAAELTDDHAGWT